MCNVILCLFIVLLFQANMSQTSHLTLFVTNGNNQLCENHSCVELFVFIQCVTLSNKFVAHIALESCKFHVWSFPTDPTDPYFFNNFYCTHYICHHQSSLKYCFYLPSKINHRHRLSADIMRPYGFLITSLFDLISC